jgi:hypothetical protein
MGFDSLSCGPAPAEAYRVLDLPSFGSATAVYLWKADGRWQLVDAEATVTGANAPQGGHGTPRLVADEDAAAVVAAVEAGQFWSAEPWQRHGIVLDGETIVLEGRRGQAYHAVTRLRKPSADVAPIWQAFWDLSSRLRRER